MNPFSKTTLWIVISVAVISLIVTVVLTVVGGDPAEHATAGANGYSRSAIGHRALIDMLEKLDVPIVVSHNASAQKSSHGLLVLAEPQLGDDKVDRVTAMIDDAANVLVVLPKWYGFAKQGDSWIESADLLPEAEVEHVANAIGIEDSGLGRDTHALFWKSADLPAPFVDRPQTISASAVTADVYNGERALVGHFSRGGKDIYVLADPDVISNFGLRRPQNAQLALQLIDRLRHDGPVVFDETVHGRAQTPSLFAALFSFPLVLATIQVIVCALLAVWAAMVRFGPSRASPPPLAPGKDFLIANTAALLRFGGHHVDALRRYFAATINQVKHALHAPANLSPVAQTEWLERMRAVRMGTIPLTELEHEVMTATPAPQRVVELADRIYCWRMEMMHGSRNRS
jgi:hypothetical protein